MSDLTLTSDDEHAVLPAQLTPRSKIKALIAAVDDDDDDLGTESANDLRPTDSLQWSAPSASKANLANKHHEEPRTRSNGFPADDEEDSSPLRPRGKLTARLNNGVASPHCEYASGGQDSDKENAYARVKKQLMRKRLKTNRSPPAMRTAIDVAKRTTSQSPTRPTHEQVKSVRGLSMSPAITKQGVSPGLFLSPRPSGASARQTPIAQELDSSDSDLPRSPLKNSKFLELAARKRAELEAKRDRKKNKKRYRKGSVEMAERGSATSSEMDSDDQEADRKLTQHDRPTRKASKKALEEMSRETQRMSRNMQLAHQARTKKRISKESLLARFNFVVPHDSAQGESAAHVESATASSLPASDHEIVAHKETPPTSPLDTAESMLDPLSQEKVDKEPPASKRDSATTEGQMENELPNMTDLLSQPLLTLQKEKAEEETPQPQLEAKKTPQFKSQKAPVRVKTPNFILKGDVNIIDSDSDLEVMPTKGQDTLRVFERVPRAEDQDLRPLQTLRALAHLNPSSDNNGRRVKPSISLAHLQISLQRRARQQALEERNAKIQDLKARGIIVQTAEEKEKEQVEVENLLEKARKDNERLREREKRAAQRANIANGETNRTDLSGEDDEDYEEGSMHEADLELSDSEDEEVIDASEIEADPEDDQAEGADEDRSKTDGNALIMEEASDDSRDDADIDADTGTEDAFDNLEVQPRRRNRMIIDEDDENDSTNVSTNDLRSFHTNIDDVVSPSRTTTVEVPKLFQHKQDSMPMGMTQAFAATMADEEDNSDSQELLEALGPPLEPELPILQVEDSLRVVEDTQDRLPLLAAADSMEPLKIDLHTSQIPIGQNSLAETQSLATQFSEIPDPTQDAGFVLSSPAPEQRFISEPPSTVDTVIIPGAGDGSPRPKKRGRLRRKAMAPASDEEKSESEPKPRSKNAFAIMEKAREKAEARASFDKTKSEAKEMVEEQAQESEDEYAGLGGASDDESAGEDDAFVKEMIDQGEVDVDEGKLAAFYADKQRLEDGKAVEKLFKDINNGGLRRKRNNDFDLSDSEDEAEARRRRKQREFAKMRKALLENENVGKIAEDPRKMAFLKALEDRDGEDDNDFLSRPAEESFRIEIDTQEDGDSQSQKQTLDELPTNEPKRPLHESNQDRTNMRPPATSRRTHAPKKPASMLEIRESVSFLVEDPGAQNTADTSSSSEDEENQQPSGRASPQNNRRRTKANPVVDRLFLKRQSSSSAWNNSNANLAFHAPTTSTNNSFVPSLLRRATSSSLSNSNSQDSHGISHHATTERAAGGGEKGDFVRRGGTKKSSVNFAAREMQRKSAVDGVERRKTQQRERAARERGTGLVGLSRSSTWEG
ncbi:uncharacterized protein KY384_006139 [Bacidia gigantensis]|uniref:uncharacterized protein n=1 Tax=Bacidia gigantensis TaxID=2732470 RepID=UPI001D0377E5|nr:uncharacterized protein KY384_006139 [Bacidia gigantensis]KAG8529502.1 hypothetical protein KY384_006139 [Bacidia gigantensis]